MCKDVSSLLHWLSSLYLVPWKSCLIFKKEVRCNNFWKCVHCNQFQGNRTLWNTLNTYLKTLSSVSTGFLGVLQQRQIFGYFSFPCHRFMPIYLLIFNWFHTRVLKNWRTHPIAQILIVLMLIQMRNKFMGNFYAGWVSVEHINLLTPWLDQHFLLCVWERTVCSVQILRWQKPMTLISV